MSLSIALLLAASAQTTPYPATQILDAFRAGCGNVKDLEETEARLKSQGWVDMMLVVGTPLEQLLSIGKRVGGNIVADKKGSLTEPYVLSRTVAGEDLAIILSGVAAQGSKVNGCRLYDVGETRTITTAEAEKWLGRKADSERSDADLSVANWMPGLGEDQDSFVLYSVPAASRLVEVLKVSGIAMKADYVGNVDE